jgi:UDP-N-acetylglucosamine--N-acetylmuramyl-(pentapeptide) pyrophosphoryl-undecaprenol N-acetylglucosamine transferase
MLVPYPYAHADHQRFNAEYVERNGGGFMVRDADLTAECVVDWVKRFIESPSELAKMADASRRLGKPNAAREIARIAGALAAGGKE